jgi:hypothetical protein
MSRSTRFEVSLAFLLQQAAWLYERHFAQMKAQMKKLSPSTCPSPGPPDSTSNVAGLSQGTGQRATSAMSARVRDSPTPTAGFGGSVVFRQTAPALPLLSTNNQQQPPPKTETLSRTPSTRTLTQSRTGQPGSPAHPNSRCFNTAFGNHRKPVSPQKETSEPESPPLQESDSESSSDGESQSMARSQAFRRSVNYTKKGRYGYDDDDEDVEEEEDDDDGESSGGFLPFATTATGSTDPAATLKSPVKRAYEQRTIAADSSASSASSAAPSNVAAANASTTATAAGTAGTAGTGKQKEIDGRGDHRHMSPASALNTRRREELSKLSPRFRKEGSEGTPSMGSSFSDLDGKRNGFCSFCYLSGCICECEKLIQ